MLSLEEETELTLQLWWRALAPPQGNYSVFIHVLNATGEIVAQADGIPLEGRYPTSAWGAGEPIVDTRILVLPSDLSAGDYSLALGLYDPVDGSRLEVVGQGVDSVHLGQLTVSP
jgi:hypothetical protein